jgi:phosphate transport system substrate-binding protein
VRIFPLAKDKKAKPVAADPENGFSGAYPLSRYLLLSINYKPKTPLSPLTSEFVKYVFSKEGQQDVIKEGFLPIPSAIVQRELTSVGLGSAK